MSTWSWCNDRHCVRVASCSAHPARSTMWVSDAIARFSLGFSQRSSLVPAPVATAVTLVLFTVLAKFFWPRSKVSKGIRVQQDQAVALRGSAHNKRCSLALQLTDSRIPNEVKVHVNQTAQTSPEREAHQQGDHGTASVAAPCPRQEATPDRPTGPRASEQASNPVSRACTHVCV